MPKKERLHETVTTMPTLEYLAQRIQDGWKLTGLEWERETTSDDRPAGPRKDWIEEIPYGLRVSDDCTRLVECAPEKEIIVLALDMIVEDCPLSRVAEELNLRGYQTREGNSWTPTALFNLLPRMIQMGPRLFTSQEWIARRKRLPKVGQ
ncbi:conserved hypothetical protein [Candidatus Sulfopaludibacter sp. SbA3]|nr:conserved hypothetical protein [Candidatus Sulfopaludibacter sp. SbA3]